MKHYFTCLLSMRKTRITLFTVALLFLQSTTTMAQLGVYNFTGQEACPNQNPAVITQPANAVFSDYINVGAECDKIDDAFQVKKVNTAGSINLSEYNQFIVTPNAGYTLSLTSLSFKQSQSDNDAASWAVRSSIDNFTTNIATGSVTENSQNETVPLSPADFTNTGAVTFRIYIIGANSNGTRWINDDVTLSGTVTAISVPTPVIPADPAAPTSNSPQCSNTGVTLNFNGAAPTGETWYWQTTATGTSTTNSAASYIVNSSGTYYLRSQDNNSQTWSTGSASIAVTVTEAAGIPVFALGATSTRCQAAGHVIYTATSTHSTALVYSLDAAGINAGNTIDPATGEVTYAAGWSGTSVITVTATGCNGDNTAVHTVTTSAAATAPVFVLGETSTRCQSAATILYTATSAGSYSLNAASTSAGNSINASTGAVTYTAGWSGTSIITATATGCNGNISSIHTVTITPATATPVFTAGATSTRCQGAGNITYTASAANNTGIIYSLDAASIAGGNSVDASSGQVTYVSGWAGTSIITVTASGCNGNSVASHTVTTTSTVGTVVFTLGAGSTRCAAAGSVTYTATATNNTGITYSLNAASISAGNSINTATGAVTYTAGWSGTSTITATAAGCNGPVSSSHTVTTTAHVSSPVFSLGTTSARCLGAGTVIYAATANNFTSMVYSLNGGSIAGGNSINTATGEVTYVSGWSGISVITVTATGCNGTQTSGHTVTTSGAVSAVLFASGTTTTRCQGAGSVTYAATATNTTGITYSLDATSIAGGNSINTTTGAVNYVAGWSGSSIITATAAGCNGPATATHTVTITPTVGTPAFATGATSTRCQGLGTVAYTATATNNTGITYSLDAATIAAGNSINTANGTVVFASNWTGTSVITAKATGCNGPVSATHTVTITPSVGIPVFTAGTSSVRCSGVSTTTYAATATNNTGISYSLDAASITGGNTINTATGQVNFVAGWSNTSIITAIAAGCNGPVSTTHTVNITANVGTPVFTGGATSTRCQVAGAVNYVATATSSTAITYSLDAASVSGGNSIITTTGRVTYIAGWSGTSTITATATGCNGPTSATHTVTTTPIVGTPIFSLGATSTRCQGGTTVTYTATAANSSAVTYSLDAASITGGNSINTTTGIVTYSAAWSGSSVITATAAGCSGPKTATHTATITASVTAPVFALGAATVRSQAAGTVTYTATASNATAKTYSLDATSIAGGNSINATTGAVTYAASWSGTSTITVSAAGCNGPLTATHIVTSNPSIVTTPLYLSDPGLALDRTDPVAAAIATTAQTVVLSSTATTNITFTQTAALAADLVIKNQPITITAYANISTGTMPVNPAITALLKYGSTTIISIANPTYNSTTKLLTWTGTLSADKTIPAGQGIALQLTTAQAGVTFKIEYHSTSKPSKISLPVSTYIDITSFNIYNAAYPNGTIRTSSTNNTLVYARAVVKNPFGASDNTGLSIKVTPPGTVVNAVSVATSGANSTYEYAWLTPPATGDYTLTATAKQGLENVVNNSEILIFNDCITCPPTLVADSAIGNGGAPIIVNAVLNDYDPNNNIKLSTLAIFDQPNNGSGYIINNNIAYLPNGSFAGKDTLIYQLCDSTGLCSTGRIYFTINPLLVDPCSEATASHVFYLPFSENEARIALDSSTNTALVSNNIRTVISMKMPYPGQVIVWDQWEDGYEVNALNPMQSSTKVWGDGNPYNGIAPGYSSDIIPAGGSIVLDNTIPTNPRVASNIFYDGRDKITSSGQITVTQVSGEPSIMAVQCMKTNVSSTGDYGKLFTIPVGQNYPNLDFKYTSLFIRAAQNNTVVNIDKDNNGTFETTATIQEGQVYHVNGGVLSGATVTGSAPIGVELHFGGGDSWSSRDVPIFPASWYYDTYYSPVPTTGSSTSIKDTNVVMLYNNLNRAITINWTSGIPSNGSINLPAKTVVRFPLAVSQTAAYKFVNPTGESFTAIQMCDSYTSGGGGNSGIDYDWSFNLIAHNRLTDFATVAWAPGSIDGTRNDNPVWVTPTANTTIYVKYDGNISGNTGSLSPCGMRYDASYTVNALNHKRLRDPNDNDQSGLAVFTCDGTKLAAVYGEDPSTAVQANPSWDVGSTIQPFCKAKLVFANDDYGRTMVSQPVTIPILLNDFGFLAVIDPSTVSTTGLLAPSHGTVTINPNGTVLYTPVPGFVGKDTFEYSVCSTPTPIVCDYATVYVDIAACPAPYNQNVITGQVYLDKDRDAVNDDGGTGLEGAEVYLYVDANCNSTAEANELKDSVTVDVSGRYQFINYPEKFVEDDFDASATTSSCASGSDGNAAWLTNWVDAGDHSSSTGFCVSGSTLANTDAEIVKDGAFSYALRLKDNNVSATRTVNLSGASYAFMSFSYRRKSATLTAGRNIIVQASKDGSTFGTVFTIAGDGTTDANYVTVYNQDITAYAAASTYIRFLTNSNVGDADTVYIDDVKVQFLRYPQCYITKLNTATIPAYYQLTGTAPGNAQKTFTATSSTTCLGSYDFGVAKKLVNISGALYNDPNGLVDNVINGAAVGLVSAIGMNAYLSDTSGKVLAKTPLNILNGTYSFTGVDMQESYSVAISALSLNLGIVPPITVNLSPGWLTTGDGYGTNNLAGTGNKSGTATAAIPVKTGSNNVTVVNFGIERWPESDNKSVSYAVNTPGMQYAVPALTGSDPEDGVLGAGKTYKITSLPANAVLYYNGTAVTLNKVITAFSSALFKIDPADGVINTTFTYASMDAAGVYDPTPATVTINWVTLLPITLLDFNGKLNGTKVDLFWKTASEINGDHFEVERSNDGQEFKMFANVKAKGNSSTETNYATVDPLPLAGLNYYRLKMVDQDASFQYSKTISIKVNSEATLETRVMPNPFTGKLDIYLTLPRASNVTFNFMDVSGKVVFTKKVKGLKGFNWFVVNDLEKLPTAPYILNLITDDKTFTQKLIKQ